MYQYKAVLKKSKELVAEGHTIEDIENQVVHLRRQQRKEHDGHVSEDVEVIHVQRDQKGGHPKEVLVKIITKDGR